MKLADRLDRMVHPIHNLQPLDTFIDQLLGSARSGAQTFVPRTDIVEHSTGFTLSIELPGVAVNDVTVEVAEGRLVVSGEKKSLVVDETSTVHRRERVAGKFERTFEFPTHVDLDKIEADSQNGVLTIIVPKSQQVLPRKIEIAAK
jgi:HSP20 family protein